MLKPSNLAVIVKKKKYISIKVLNLKTTHSYGTNNYILCNLIFTLLG